MTLTDATLDEARALYGDGVSAHHVELSAEVEQLLDGFRDAGLNPLLVGGSVRDSFDGTTPKDLDFEVYGGTVDQVEAVARSFGRVDAVGKAFGVLKMPLANGEDIDLSVPRRDNKTGVGHRGFTVDLDESLTVSEAAERRDFTINAMSYDHRLGVLIDPHGGRADLEDGILRHISPAFAEDPLRVMRGMQFASRFGMVVHPHTVELARSLRPEAADLPDERLRGEWAKWATKARRPSDGLRVLHQTGWDREFPGLAAVNDLDLQAVCDRTHELLRAGTYGSQLDHRVALAAVLVRGMDDADARAFLNRTVEGAKAQRHSLQLARDTRTLPMGAGEARTQALTGPSVRERALLTAGRGDEPTARVALAVAEEAGVADRPETDLFTGQDVMTAAPSRRPGPWMAALIAEARRAQAARAFADRDGAVSWLTAALATQTEAPPR